MVNGALQVCGLLIGILGWVMAIITCAHPTWKKNDLEGEVIESLVITAGLWIRCTQQATGYWSCNDYDSFFLGLPPALQGSRATTCVSIALGFIAVILSTFGLSCTNVAADNPRMKARVTIIAGVINVIAGVSLGVGVSWYAANVLQEYNNPLVAGTLRYVYGDALFVGWVGMAVSFLAGILMCCSSWGSDDDDDDRRPYVYNPPKPKVSSAEYI